jgi:hypothetical protein
MHCALDLASSFRGFRVRVTVGLSNGMLGAISTAPVSGELALGAIAESVRT